MLTSRTVLQLLSPEGRAWKAARNRTTGMDVVHLNARPPWRRAWPRPPRYADSGNSGDGENARIVCVWSRGGAFKCAGAVLTVKRLAALTSLLASTL